MTMRSWITMLAPAALIALACNNEEPSPAGDAGASGASAGISGDSGAPQGGENEGGRSDNAGEAGQSGEPGGGEAGQSDGGQSGEGNASGKGGGGTSGVGGSGNSGTGGVSGSGTGGVSGSGTGGVGGSGTGGVGGSGTGGIGGSGTGGVGGSGTGGSGTGGASGAAGESGSPCDGVVCSGHGACEESEGEARCDCDPGFAPPGAGALTCENVDECATDNGGCDPLTLCTDTDGSYSCGACPPGYDGTGQTGCVAKACAGDPGIDCPCIKVTSDGDDGTAAASYGALPFGTIQAAIDFAAAHRNVATNVCVVGGATCSDPVVAYPGPADTELRLRDGISVYGSYLPAAPSRCAEITTRLVPSTAKGVYFGPDIVNRTRLDRFSVALPASAPVAGITIDGADEVEVSDIRFDEAVVPGDVIGIDVSGEAYAALDGIDGHYGTVGGKAIGVRVRQSEISMTGGYLSLVSDAGTARGVELVDSNATLANVRIALDESSVASGAESGDVILAGIDAQGGEEIDLADVTVGITDDEWVGEPLTLINYGVHIVSTGDLRVQRGLIDVEEGVGIYALDSRIALGETRVHADGDISVGVWLENAPGSRIDGVEAAGARATGVRVQGDGTGIEINDVGIAADIEGFAVDFESCAGASPVLRGNVAGLAGPFVPNHTGVASAIRARGDCHPVIDQTTIALRGRYPGSLRAVLCDAADGIASRCVVTNTMIRVDYEAVTPGGEAYVVGVDCRGGSCAEVRATVLSVNEVIGCMRSCYRGAFGVIYDATQAVSDSGVGATLCQGAVVPPEFACWDRVVNQYGYDCPNGTTLDVETFECR